jgi:two-component system, cell cycle response regulator
MASRESADYFARFGFDESTIQQRLSWLRLAPADHSWARRLHEQVIAPHADVITDQFYTALDQDPEFIRLVGGRAVHLRPNLIDYLQHFGLGFDTRQYFNACFHLGIAHLRAGIPLSFFKASFFLLQQVLLDFVPPAAALPAGDYEGLVSILVRLIALDMTLATDTYHLSEIRALQSQASTDALTGLFNHGAIMTELHQRMARAREQRRSLCIAMVDIDFFKKVNDTYGHLAGDRVLAEVASRIRAAVRSFDIAGRYGGEEFLLVFSDTDLQMAQVVAERVRQAVAATPVANEGKQIPVTISLGVALASGSDIPDQIIERADRALYVAKTAGRNRTALGTA